MHAWVLAASVLAVACSSATTDDDPSDDGNGIGGNGGNGNGGDGGSGGDDGSGAGGSAPMDGDPGLMGCGLPLSCGMMRTHIFPNDLGDPSAGFCAAGLLVSGAPGVLLHEHAPGPYNCPQQQIYLYLGDGTAVRQSRGSLGCGAGLDPVFADATAQELCQVTVPQSLVTACEAATPSVSAGGNGQDDCNAFPESHVTNCQPIEPLTCDEALAFLSTM